MVKLSNQAENYKLYYGTELLAAEGETGGDTQQTTQPDNAGTTDPEPSFFSKYGMFILLGVILVLIIVWMLFSGRKGKQRQKEYAEQLEAIRPGNKVKTAGGICGVVVEVCDDNTVILETGSESAGKSYIKMDKELIAQTDAKGPTQLARERAEEERRAAKEAQEAQKRGDAAPPEPAEPETPAPTDTPEEK